MPDRAFICKLERPSVQSRVRLVDGPSSLSKVQEKYYVEYLHAYSCQSRHKVGGLQQPARKLLAAFGGTTSFVVCFVLALKRVPIVALRTILVLHDRKPSARQADFRSDEGSMLKLGNQANAWERGGGWEVHTYITSRWAYIIDK